MNLNVRAAFHILRAAIPHMRNQRRGSIGAMGSRAGAEPAADIAADSASKAALVSLVRTAALENRDLGWPGSRVPPLGSVPSPKSDQKKGSCAKRLLSVIL